jgi:hypothetical protein
MGYIVDLTIVLEVLFWLKVAQPRHQSICEEDITAAFGLYQGSPEHLEVHQQIRSYVDDMILIDQVNPQDNTHAEIERLINPHRRVSIDTIFSDAECGLAPVPDAPSSPNPSLLPSRPSTFVETGSIVSFSSQTTVSTGVGRTKSLWRNPSPSSSVESLN